MSNDYSFSIDGTRMTWQSWTGSDWDVFLYDDATGEVRQLSTNSSNNTGSRIFGNYVVWSGSPNDAGDSEIFLYDIATKTTRQLTNNTVNDTDPRLSNDLVVWTETVNGRQQVFAYDLKDADATPVQISWGYSTTTCSEVDVSGSYAVWTATTGANSAVVLYDGQTGIARQISSSASSNFHAAISGTNVVWERLVDADHSVMHYDILTGVPTQLSRTGVNGIIPQISGDNAVWIETANGLSQVVYCNVAVSGSIKNVTTGSGEYDSPQVCGNRIVWQTRSQSDYDIYYWEIGNDSGPADISNNGQRELGAMVSDSMVGWLRYGVNGYEIIRAKQVAAEIHMSIPIQIVGDTKLESNEQFYLNLIKSDLATIATSQVPITIINDDGPMDYGDAFDPTYPTKLASDGARHLVTSSLYLGSLIDVDADGQSSLLATGDDTTGSDDEDGVVFSSPIVRGGVASVAVTVKGNGGKLDAWIDYNNDGVWSSDEQIFVSQSVNAGVNQLSFQVPASGFTPGTTTARFRLSSAGGLAPSGFAMDGEVEDYSVQLTDNVQLVGGKLLVGGTAGDDVFTFWAGTLLIVQLNDQIYKFDPASVDTIIFDGGDGKDTANFYGSYKPETITFYGSPSLDTATGLLLDATFAGDGFVVKTTHTEVSYAVGNGGADAAVFHDSTGNDDFSARPRFASMSCKTLGTVFSASGFGTMNATASTGINSAILYDSLGDDNLTGDYQAVTLSGSGFSNTVRGFANVWANASSGLDTVTLTDSPDADKFTSAGEQGQRTVSLASGSYTISANRFDRAWVTSTRGGRDVAKLYDTAGDDLLEMSPTLTTLTGAGVDDRVAGFYTVSCIARSGGNDAAVLHDSVNADTLVRNDSHVTLTDGKTYALENAGFDLVDVYSSKQADDVARFYDSARTDTFVAKPTLALLTDGAYDETTDSVAGSSYQVRAHDFRSVFAISTHDGADKALLYDSAETDTFVATPDHATMSSTSTTSPYYNRAIGFKDVTGIAGKGYPAGSPDVASLYGSAGSDSFVATPTSASMSDGAYVLKARNFRVVTGYAVSGGTTQDTAYLTGSANDDVFTGSPTFSMLSDNTTFDIVAMDFQKVEVNGEAGANAASLFGSVGNDVFNAGRFWGSLAGTVNAKPYTIEVNGFKTIDAYGHQSETDHDVATLYDSVLSDRLVAQSDVAELSGVADGLNVDYMITVHDYDFVAAKSSQGGSDTKKTDALDFLLSATGNWIDEN
jgi:beta propeller repeat protein